MTAHVPVTADRTAPAADWTLVLVADGGWERLRDTLLTLADGRFAVRGVRVEDALDAGPITLAAGVYDAASPGLPGLLDGPVWSLIDALPAAPDVAEIRRLDLRGGVLERVVGRVRTLRFLSLARPGTAGLRIEAPGGGVVPGPSLRAPRDPQAQDVPEAAASGEDGVLATGGAGGGIVAAARTRTFERDGTEVVERLACLRADPDALPSAAGVRADLAAAEAVGFDALLAEHRACWQARWDEADVAIAGDPAFEQAVRLALFHLIGSVADEGEAAVGARGMTGHAYAGHVFWDADVFVLPFLAATHPAAARAMLEYRVNRLPAARAAATACGADGARFPWESARTGEDVTPAMWCPPGGPSRPILTGRHEEHIVADVAWAAVRYARWSGDDAFLRGRGAPLVLDAARYWASRLRPLEDGHLHLLGVIGPDEYHELVDDNAYTNVMARWTLRAAADLSEAIGADPAERRRWRDAAARIVDGFDPATGVYEQFTGYHRLEPLLMSGVAEPPVAADLMLGPERVAGSQIVKQADVLMLHHLVPDEVAPSSLGANLDHYLPRTAHGSSLSLPVHAALLARAGRPEHARILLEQAVRLDLDDLTGTAAAGLHLATYGGIWQALVGGFLGLRPTAAALQVEPSRLPARWQSLQARVQHHGVRMLVRLDERGLSLSPHGSVRVTWRGVTGTVGPEGHTFEEVRR